MCSRLDGDSIEDAIRRDPLQKPAIKCVKCKQATPTVRIRHADYCTQCFESGTFIKFQKSLGMLQCLPQDRILMAVSGGPSSCAMLEMLTRGNGPDLHASRRKFKALIIAFVDESEMVKDTIDRLSFVQAICARYGVTVVTNKISSCAETDDLAALSKSLSFDSQEDLLGILRTRCLIRLAQENSCKVILTGESSTRVAIQTISLTSKGRGYTLAQDIAAESVANTASDVIFARPMKVFLAKEIGMFNHINKLPSCPAPVPSTGLQPKASIDRLTGHFLAGLEADFPSTVSTVTRTVNKLQITKPQKCDNIKKCLVCQADVQENALAWKENVTVQGVSHEISEESLCYCCEYMRAELSKSDRKVSQLRPTKAEIVDQFLLPNDE